jgi:hypothetical protein
MHLYQSRAFLSSAQIRYRPAGVRRRADAVVDLHTLLSVVRPAFL